MATHESAHKQVLQSFKDRECVRRGIEITYFCGGRPDGLADVFPGHSADGPGMGPREAGRRWSVRGQRCLLGGGDAVALVLREVARFVVGGRGRLRRKGSELSESGEQAGTPCQRESTLGDRVANTKPDKREKALDNLVCCSAREQDVMLWVREVL